MTIYTQDYREWNGEYRTRVYKVLGMIQIGIKRAWSSKWVKFCLILGWIPAVFFVVSFLVFPPFMKEMVAIQGPNSFFSQYFSLQVLWTLLLVATTGSSLISEDIENKSITLYYSSPIKKKDYLFGKFGIIGIFIALVTAVPSTFLYWSLILLGTTEIRSTLWVWGGCILYSLILIGFFGILILFLSSLTENSKYAGASLFGLYFGTSITSAILYELIETKWAAVTSLIDNLTIIQRKIFRMSLDAQEGFVGTSVTWYHSFSVIIGICVILGIILYLRVRTLELSE